MHDSDLDAERIKLARLLNVEEGELSFLTSAHSSQLRQLREGLSDTFYRRHQENYARLAKLSRVLPLGASAKLAETVMGTVLGAGVSGEMDPERAARLAEKLSPKFLARLCIHMEPRRANNIITEIPKAVVVNVARELVAMGEYITLARFVTAISADTLHAVIEGVNDNAALLRVGIFVEERDTLSRLLEQVSDLRRRALLQAATDGDLWPQTLVLLTHLSDKMKGVMGDVTVSLGETVMATVAKVTREHSLWEPWMLSVANMQASNRQQVMAMPALLDDGLLNDWLAENDSERLWALTLRLWQDAPAALLDKCFAKLAQQPASLAGLLQEVHVAGLGGGLKGLLERLSPEVRAQFEQVAQRDHADDFAAVTGG